jgi:hypothetical protein
MKPKSGLAIFIAGKKKTKEKSYDEIEDTQEDTQEEPENKYESLIKELFSQQDSPAKAAETLKTFVELCLAEQGE